MYMYILLCMCVHKCDVFIYGHVYTLYYTTFSVLFFFFLQLQGKWYAMKCILDFPIRPEHRAINFVNNNNS